MILTFKLNNWGDFLMITAGTKTEIWPVLLKQRYGQFYSYDLACKF